MKSHGPRAFVIGAASSGAGKTTVTLAVLAALERRGLVVRPFKAGPDYIDPGHHSAVAGRASYNLDTWMMGADGVRSTFASMAAPADVAVVEGVMGLFDGRGGGGFSGCDDGSTASLARALGLPVLLVVNAEKTAGSVAAVVKGFESFDPGVEVRWVVFNRVAGPRHFAMLKGATAARTGVRVLGYLPRDPLLEMPSRHLGLVTRGHMKRGGWRRFIKRAAWAAEEHIDLDGLMRSSGRVKAARRGAGGGGKGRAGAGHGGSPPGARIAVARDDAFCFYYEENLDILTDMGAELVFFSPLKASGLPRGTSGLYIGGGYPELHAPELEANETLKGEIKRAAAAGMPVFAECGGLMYLGRSIATLDGHRHAMAGVFPWSARMLTRRAALGYREVKALPGCPFLDPGLAMRGHEYHYSTLSRSAAGVQKTFATDGPALEGYLRGGALATYVHLHFRSNPAFARGLVARAAGFRGAPGGG